MKLKTLALIGFLCAASLTVAGDTVVLIAEGSGATQREARRQACLSALRSAAGTHLYAVTHVQEMADVWSRVAEFTDGYVVHTSVLDPPVCEAGRCRVRLEVEIALEPLEADLRNLSEMIGDPVVTVVPGNNEELSWRASELLENILTTIGLTPSATLIQGDAPETGYDMVLEVAVESQTERSGAEYISFVDLRVEVQESTTGLLLTSRNASGRGNSTVSAARAGRDAVQSAVDKLRGTLAASLRQTWSDFLSNGQVFRIVLDAPDSGSGGFLQLREAIQLVPGLRSINERAVGPHEAVIDVRFNGLAGEFLTHLHGPLRGQGFEIARLAGRRIDIVPRRERAH